MPTTQTAPAAEALPLSYPSPGERVGNYRWVICALLFFGTTINYVDRSAIGILGPELRDKLHIDKEQFGYVMAAFGLAYAAGQAMAGGMLDKVGVRIGYGAGLVGWCLASMGHALVRTASGFGVMRALLGITESPCYPADNKAAAEWFPRRERAFVMGFVNAGSNVGIIVAMLMVPPLTKAFGWQGAFLGTGALGLIWLAFWIPIYRKPELHPRVSAAELAYIQSDPPEPAGKVRWATLLGYRQAWAFALSKFITDAIWMFFFTWLPLFLNERYNLDLAHLGLPLVIVYVLADLGSIGGGWLSGAMIRSGATINRARKTAMLIGACCVVPVCLASSAPNAWWCALLLGMATAGHQAFSANQYAMVSDIFPKRAVASVSGIGGTFGYVGGAIYNVICGNVLQTNHNHYVPLLMVAAVAYLVAFTIVQVFAPTLEPAAIDQEN
jgi:MFS transporter, ACS family, hexuronate transporter